MTLEERIMRFIRRWGPGPYARESSRKEFINELRYILEQYGKAALQHQSLPDTEHEHGDPA